MIEVRLRHAQRGLLRGEFFSLLLFSLLGMMLLASANSFLTVFLGLELMSLCLYALVALNRDSALATEAAMKYFVLGALSSGLLLYGMSMIYGATGTLTITAYTEDAATGANLGANATGAGWRSYNRASRHSDSLIPVCHAQRISNRAPNRSSDDRYTHAIRPADSLACASIRYVTSGGQNCVHLLCQSG